MRGLVLVWLVAVVALASVFGVAGSHAAAPPADWRSDWAATGGFAIVRDTAGYHFPTAIAVVPRPGSGPTDPLYFVTELRGRIRVVTGNRTVHTFAEDFFRLVLARELPHPQGENGLAGICLDPERGYVFATFVYQDDGGALRNNIARFSTTPGTFALTPTSVVNYSRVFASDLAAPSHQIGGCQVAGGWLYVGVGDGQQPRAAQRLDSTLGKVLRLPLDPHGPPVTDNPFHQDDRMENPRNHVWAYGLRNPFGIRVVDGRVFVGENGVEIDRFLEVERGRNYQWNGTDWSIGINASAVFAPAISPVQMDYQHAQEPLPAAYRGTFFIALAADTRDPLRRQRPGVLAVRYDLVQRRVADIPRYLVEYRGGTRTQAVTGVSLGEGGLYFVPIYPDAAGESAVYRTFAAPDREHPIVLGRDLDAVTRMRDWGCFGCHASGGYGGTFGPPLDSNALYQRLRQRLHSDEYEHAIELLRRTDPESVREFRAARDAVMAARGLERVRLWLRHKIRAPRFDNPSAQMPTLGVSEREAAFIADYLLRDAAAGLNPRALVRRLPPPRHRHAFYTFVAGAVIAAVAVTLWRRRRA